MNRFSVTRKLSMFLLSHPKALEQYVKVAKKVPTIPRGYRKIMKK